MGNPKPEFVFVSACLHYQPDGDNEEGSVSKIVKSMLPISQPVFLPYSDTYYSPDEFAELSIIYSEGEPSRPGAGNFSKSAFVANIHTHDRESIHYHFYITPERLDDMLKFQEDLCSAWGTIELSHCNLTYTIDIDIEDLGIDSSFVERFGADKPASGISFTVNDEEYQIVDFYDSVICTVSAAPHQEIDPMNLESKIDQFRDRTNEVLNEAELT